MPPQSRGTVSSSGSDTGSAPQLRNKRLTADSPTNERPTTARRPLLRSKPNTDDIPHIGIDVGSGMELGQRLHEDDASEESGQSEEDDFDGEGNSQIAAHPLHVSRSHNDLQPTTTTGLFPPFYNRPPIPLPPSPSLSSLLRPSFSAATSRPTTPESSDVDVSSASGIHTHGTGKRPASTTNLASSARHAPTVPRASPKVPTYEYYGFALYLGSSAAFLMYILWAYVPAPLLHQMGIHYYPNRWWALAVPCWLVVLVVYIYVALASYNTKYLTLPMDSIENLVDECAQVAVVDCKTGEIVRESMLHDKLHDQDKGSGGKARVGRHDSLSAYRFEAGQDVDWPGFWSTGTDAVMDVPIGGVCEVLYGNDE